MVVSRLLFCVLVILLLTLAGQAATISGTVYDKTGGALVGVDLEVISLATGISRHASSGRSGYYQVAFLDPGKYSVKARHPGFADSISGAVLLRVDRQANVDFYLELSPLANEVTVSGSVVIAEESASASEELGAQAENMKSNVGDLMVVINGNSRDGNGYYSQKGRKVGLATKASLITNVFAHSAKTKLEAKQATAPPAREVKPDQVIPMEDAENDSAEFKDF